MNPKNKLRIYQWTRLHTRVNMNRHLRSICNSTSNDASMTGDTSFNPTERIISNQYTFIIYPGQYVRVHATNHTTAHHQFSQNHIVIAVAAGSTIQIISNVTAAPIKQDVSQQHLLDFTKTEVLYKSRSGISIQPGEILSIDAAEKIVPEELACRASSSKTIPHITLQPGETFTITVV